MPKIIDNVREKVIAETRTVLEEQGFEMLAMRDIAMKCGIAVGTMYNYFPSKEYLTGCVVLEDWEGVYNQMTAFAASANDMGQGLQGIYEMMQEFAMRHRYLTAFDRRTATGKFDFSQRHIILLKQIEELLKILQNRFDYSMDASITTFMAENILKLSAEKYSYSQIAPAFMKLLS